MHNRRGFTIIELIVVVAIIAILAGLGVPYYLDSIADSRRSVLRQNLANFRKVLNDFKGDHGRGPFRVPVCSGTTILMSDPKSNDPASGSELVAGPIQYDQTKSPIEPVRRANLQYLPKLPILEDPDTGQPVTWDYGSATVYFFDDGTPGQFDIMNEFWFRDEDRNGVFNRDKDTILSYKSSNFGAGGHDIAFYEGQSGSPLDYTDVKVTISGVSY